MKLRRQGAEQSGTGVRGGAGVSGAAHGINAPVRAIAAFSLAASMAGCTFDASGLAALDAHVRDAGSEIRRDSKGEAKGAIDARISDRRLGDAPTSDSKVVDAAADSRPNTDNAVADSPMVEGTKPADIGSDAYLPCASASLGSFNGQMPIGSAMLVGGYSFNYLGDDAGGNSKIDITCGGSCVSCGKAFPYSVKTTIGVPSDNRVIAVLPQFSSASWLQAAISVKKP